MNITTLIGILAALGTTSSFLPQAIKTIRTKETAGISLSMYSLFTSGTFLWLVYGIMANSLPIMISNAITLVLAVIILFYKIKYK